MRKNKLEDGDFLSFPRYADSEKERMKKIGDEALMDYQRWLFQAPTTVGHLRELGLDRVHDSFLPFRDGLSSEQESWKKINAEMKHIKEDQPSDEEVVRPLQNEEDEIYLERLKEVIADSGFVQELKERGFEFADQVKVSDIGITEVIKRPMTRVESGPTEYAAANQGVPLEAYGTIELDSPALLDGPQRFNWRIEWTVETSIELQLRLHNAPRGLIDKERLEEAKTHARRPYSQMQFSIDFGDLSPKDRPFNVSDARDRGVPLTIKQKEFVEKFGLRDEKIHDDDRDYNYDLAYTMGKNIGTSVALEIRHYIEKEFDPDQHLDADKYGVAYEIMSRISKMNERERDQLFIDGLEKGELDTMFLYTGEGAKHFIEIIESEQYKIANKEADLIKNNEEQLANEIKDSEVYDLGSGDGRKTKILLERLAKEDKDKDIFYHPVDGSIKMLNAAAQQTEDLPQVKVKGHHEDFRQLDKIVDKSAGKNSILFLGSTIGNFSPEEQKELIESIKEAMKSDESLLIGVEMERDLEKLKPAYEGEENEKFIKLVLQQCGVSPDKVDFSVEINKENNCFNLILTFNQETPVDFKGYKKTFNQGEKIQIAVSHKYINDQLPQMIEQTGLKVTNKFISKNQDFQLISAKLQERE